MRIFHRFAVLALRPFIRAARGHWSRTRQRGDGDDVLNVLDFDLIADGLQGRAVELKDARELLCVDDFERGLVIQRNRFEKMDIFPCE